MLQIDAFREINTFYSPSLIDGQTFSYVEVIIIITGTMSKEKWEENVAVDGM